MTMYHLWNLFLENGCLLQRKKSYFECSNHMNLFIVVVSQCEGAVVHAGECTDNMRKKQKKNNFLIEK